MLVDLKAIFAEHKIRITQYNGGWLKRITGLNIARTDLYSILGSYIKGETGTNREFTYDITPGLYLYCDIQGSRRQTYRNYILFIFSRSQKIIVQSHIFGIKTNNISEFHAIIDELLCGSSIKK